MIFKYDLNNFVKNEINNMPIKRRKKIFKLMNLLGDFSLVTPLYADCSEMTDNVKIITYDKDDSKVTFYPRSINMNLERLVFIDEYRHCEAYSINSDNITLNNLENLKEGETYYFSDGIVIVNNKGFIKVLLYNGLTYIADISLINNNDFLINFDLASFMQKISFCENLEFENFTQILVDSLKNIYEINMSCINEGLVIKRAKANCSDINDQKEFTLQRKKENEC